MGVWIETDQMAAQFGIKASHPAWVCGLKLAVHRTPQRIAVTPCVGVWIETLRRVALLWKTKVTPCVGVWIETVMLEELSDGSYMSHPAWVCGLKPF